MTREEALKFVVAKDRACVRVGDMLVCLGYVAAREDKAAAALGLSPVVLQGETNWNELNSLHWTKRLAWVRAKQIMGEL